MEGPPEDCCQQQEKEHGGEDGVDSPGEAYRAFSKMNLAVIVVGRAQVLDVTEDGCGSLEQRWS